MTKKFFDSIIKLRFDKKKAGKEKFYDAKKKPIKIWDDDVNNAYIPTSMPFKTGGL